MALPRCDLVDTATIPAPCSKRRRQAPPTTVHSSAPPRPTNPLPLENPDRNHQPLTPFVNPLPYNIPPCGAPRESRYLKLSFHSVGDLMEVKKALMPTIQANKTRAEAQDAYSHADAQGGEQQPDDFLSVLVDAREYDVPYYVRCSIDLDIRCAVCAACCL